MITFTIISTTVAVMSLLFNVYLAISKGKKEDTTKQTTVIVTLETIRSDVTEIKTDMRSIKADRQRDHDELIVIKNEIKTMWQRIDELKALVRKERT